MNGRHPKHNADFERLRKNPAAGAGDSELFRCGDGARLFVQSWLPAGRPVNQVVLCLHGMNAHGYYYALMADVLVPAGIAVYSPDYRHHGLSEGSPGDMDDPRRVVEDIRELAVEIKSRHPGTPFFALGESMGGAICINLIADNKDLADGMILIAPALFPSTKAGDSPRVAASAKMFLSAVFRNPADAVIPATGGEERGIRNPDNIIYDKNDPHHLKAISPRYLASAGRLIARAALAGWFRISIPSLIFQGGDDHAVSMEATELFYKLLSSKDKTYKFYPSAFHCMQTDPDCEDMPIILRDWIIKRG